MKHISRHTKGATLRWRNDYFVISTCLLDDIHCSEIFNNTKASKHRPVRPTSSL